jgi:hypothetical protein
LCDILWWSTFEFTGPIQELVIFRQCKIPGQISVTGQSHEWLKPWSNGEVNRPELRICSSVKEELKSLYESQRSTFVFGWFSFPYFIGTHYSLSQWSWWPQTSPIQSLLTQLLAHSIQQDGTSSSLACHWCLLGGWMFLDN